MRLTPWFVRTNQKTLHGVNMKNLTAAFPHCRLRRNRREQWCRDLVAETQLSPKDFILPLFIREDSAPKEIEAMPGVSRYTLSELTDICTKVYSKGVRAVILFPYVNPDLKCDEGLEALNSQNLLCRAVQKIKQEIPDLGVIADVALDLFTTHGHDGVLRNGHVANDETVTALQNMSLVLADAGVDVIAPSDMMDGRVGAIRQSLDENGHEHVRILAYTAKYASNFYGPYRLALGSQSALGKADKKSYQMDPANALEALREGAQDVMEGADMLMVKPGLAYLDIIYRLKETFSLPIFAFQISGEYSILRVASERGLLEYDKALIETLIAFKRAGASCIITYGALDAVDFLYQ